MLYPPFYIFPREFSNFFEKSRGNFFVARFMFSLQMLLLFGKILVIIYINFLSFHFRPLPKACFFKKRQGASKFHEIFIMF